MRFVVSAIGRDLRIYFRNLSDILNPMVFFIVVVSLFPLGVGPAPAQLAEIAPGVVWVAALLATLMSMELMFRSDFEDGTLDQLIVSGQSLIGYVLAKALGHWIVSGLPLLLLMPLVGIMMFVDTSGIWALSVSLLLVSPTLSLLGAIGAGLTVGLPRGGLLITILILPLYIPVLILATSMVGAAVQGSDVTGYVYWLAALMLGALALAPLATAAALRISADQ